MRYFGIKYSKSFSKALMDRKEYSKITTISPAFNLFKMSFWNFKKQKEVSLKSTILEVSTSIQIFLDETDFDRIFGSEEFERVVARPKEHFENYLAAKAYQNYLAIIMAGSLLSVKAKSIEILENLSDLQIKISNETFLQTLPFHEEYIINDKIFIGDSFSLNSHIKEKVLFYGEFRSIFFNYTKELSESFISGNIYWDEDYTDLIVDDLDDATPSSRIYYSVYNDILLSRINSNGHVNRIELYQTYDIDYSISRAKNLLELMKEI